MVLPAGKVSIPNTSDEIRRRMLEDIELEAYAEGIDEPPIHPGSEIYIRTGSTANAVMGCYAALSLADAERRILTATRDGLDEIREEKGLPEVKATAASGSVIAVVQGGATITVPDGTQFLLPNGKRGKVNGAHVGVTNTDLIAVITIDKGEDCNLSAGNRVTFVNPPTNLEFEAAVSPDDPITGGLDIEGDARLRARLLNNERNRPGGGNWAEAIEVALNASADVQYAFVYPALGGPGSVRVAIMRAPVFDADPNAESLSRVAPASALADVRGALFAHYGDGTKVSVESVVDVNCSVAIQVDIPDSEQTGGDGTGWVDDEPWPELTGNDNGYVRIIQRTNLYEVTLSANTTVAPPVGNSIAYWSNRQRKFFIRRIEESSGSPGNWTIRVDQPLQDEADPSHGVALNEWISPAAINSVAYGETWRQVLQYHGPGENTSDANRLSFASRKPPPTEPAGGQTWPMRVTHKELCTFSDAHEEIENALFGYRSPVEPTAPPFPSAGPEILIPYNFGVYKRAFFNQ